MKFSVIIPACQEQNYIEKTLKSIPKNVEKIVVANGCTDRTTKIAKKYAKVIETKKRNVSLARNLGAKKAKGNILIFLDADTLLTKNCLSKIKQCLKKNVVGTCKVKPDINKLKYKVAMNFKNLFLWAPWTSGITFCFKSSFNKINGFNKNITKGEVGDFISRAKNLGKYGIANCYVINSMRRLEKWGILKLILYWIKEEVISNKKPYPIVR